MPDDITLSLTWDTSEAQELIGAAQHAIETGQMTEDEAIEVLASFVRVRVDEQSSDVTSRNDGEGGSNL